MAGDAESPGDSIPATFINPCTEEFIIKSSVLPTARKPQKDVIVLKNGKKVFPEELEMLVDKLEEVEESFIYGMPQNGNNNDPMVSLEVVYTEDAIKDKTEEELKKIIWDKVKEINKTLPQYKYIKNPPILLSN